MTVQVTSIISYYEALQTLGSRQLEVLKALKCLKVANNLMISRFLGLPINSVTPRCLELKKKGIIIYHHTGACPINGRATRFFTIKSYINDCMN